MERSQSTQGLGAQSRMVGQKSVTLVEAEKVMKPIRTNHYVNEKGFIKLAEKSNVCEIKNQSSF